MTKSFTRASVESAVAKIAGAIGENSVTTIGQVRSASELDPYSDHRPRFAALISTTNAQLKSKRFCIDSRRIFFAFAIRCIAPYRPAPASLYADYRATLQHENLARIAHGSLPLSQVSYYRFYALTKGLLSLSKSLSKAVQKKASNYAR